MPENQIFDVRADVDQSAKSRLDRNRLWWERMPMTYASWDSSDRLPQREADYREMESFLLARTAPFSIWDVGPASCHASSPAKARW
jgi:hypothetical protein